MKETFMKNCMLEPEAEECTMEINSDICWQDEKQARRGSPLDYGELISRFNEKVHRLNLVCCSMFSINVYIILTSLDNPVDEILRIVSRELFIFIIFLFIRWLIIRFWKRWLGKDLKNILPDIVRNIKNADRIRINRALQAVVVECINGDGVLQQHLLSTIPVHTDPGVKQPVLHVSAENPDKCIWAEIPG